MSIWATRLYLKDETAPFKYDHYNHAEAREGELEIAWPPGDYSSLRLYVNEERILLDRAHVAAIQEVLTRFSEGYNTGTKP